MTVGAEHRLILKSFTDDEYVFKRVKDSQAGRKTNSKHSDSSAMATVEEQECNIKQTRVHFYDTIYSKQKNKTEKT